MGVLRKFIRWLGSLGLSSVVSSVVAFIGLLIAGVFLLQEIFELIRDIFPDNPEPAQLLAECRADGNDFYYIEHRNDHGLVESVEFRCVSPDGEVLATVTMEAGDFKNLPDLEAEGTNVDPKHPDPGNSL